LRIRLGYPDLDDEIRVLDRQQHQHPIVELQQIASLEELLDAQKDVKGVFVSASVKRYMVEVARQSRQHNDVYLGASPRGSLALFRTSQARAAVHGRDYVLPDDVKTLARSALAHRIILGPAARLRDLNAENIVDDILDNLPVPGGDLSFSPSKT